MDFLERQKRYDTQESQIFFCVDKDGYSVKKRHRNGVEKQSMYDSYPLVLQVGFRTSDVVRIVFKDGTERVINPNTLKINARPTHLSMKPIRTLILEPKEE